jgi:hypothetical protein
VISTSTLSWTALTPGNRCFSNLSAVRLAASAPELRIGK